MIGLPIIRKELLGNGRARFFLVRGVYLVLATLVAIPLVLALADELGQQTVLGPAAPKRGLQHTLQFGLMQLAFVVVIAPALSATALARERASGVLELLLVAGIGPVDVVLGKLVARTLWLGLCVFSGIPLLLLTGMVLGGAGFETVALFTAHSLVAALLGSALGILVSGAFRSALPAVLGAYVVQFAVYGLPLMHAYSSARGPTDPAYLASGPAAIIEATLGALPSEVAWLALFPPLLLAAVFTVASVPYAHPTPEKTRAATLGDLGVALLEGSREGVRQARTSSDRPSRPVTGNPVGWREARSHRYGFWSRMIRLTYVGIGGAIAVHLFVFTMISEYRGLARFGVGSLALGAAAIGLVISTISIASEREARTLSLLRLSYLSAAEILFGKLLGLSRFLWPVVVLPVIPAVAFLALDNSAFVLTLVLVAVLFLSACAVGFFFSTLFRSGSLALTAALATGIAWLGLVPYAASWLRPESRGRLLALTHPVASVLAVVSGFAPEPRYARWNFGPDPWDFSEYRMFGWAGILGIAFLGALAFLLAGIRIDREEGGA